MPAIGEILDELAADNRLRTIPSDWTDGMTDLSSNDYLGLAIRVSEFRSEFNRRYPDVCFSSSASRLLASNQRQHLDFENYLAALYGKPALLFNSGYHANVGAIGALTLPSTLFLTDRLIHASVIDGLKCAGSVFKRFPHNDVKTLHKILCEESGRWERIILVVESIYSMDGDMAPLTEIATFKDTFPEILLYVDEAHALGVRGLRGLGLCEEKGLIGKTDILIGTLGKAAASTGAFIICSETLKSLLVNRARPFIFSTALPPANQAWSMMMMENILSANQLRRHLAELSLWFRRQIEEITRRPNPSRSQIIPLMTGDASRALKLAATLREAGIIALPIRRPTVPPGGERIRFSLSAAMTMKQLLPVTDILRKELQ